MNAHDFGYWIGQLQKNALATEKSASKRKLIDMALRLSDAGLNKLVPASGGEVSGAALREARRTGTYKAPIYLNSPQRSLFGNPNGVMVAPSFRQHMQRLIRQHLKQLPVDRLAQKQPGSVLAKQEARNYW